METEASQPVPAGDTRQSVSGGPEWKEAAAVYLTAAFSITAIHFLARFHVWPGAHRFLTGLCFGEEWLGDLVFWALASVFFYMVPATVVSWTVLKRSPLRLGLGLGLLPRHAWLYGLYFAGVFPVVWLSSCKADFLQTYPFDARIAKDFRFFLCWEAVYCLQFLALEYFFRGFLLFPLEKKLGAAAVFAMTVPYAMLHFQKPFLEANAAVFAGLILGFTALRSRSIWGGVFLHSAVAVTMDVMALWRRGEWPPGQ